MPDADVTRARTRRTGLAAQLPQATRTFLNTESASALAMLAATVIGLVWANSPWSDGYRSLLSTELALRVGEGALVMDLEHWVNDGLMALFFFVIGLEVRREFSVGELTDHRRVRLPLLAGIGGMALPAALYLLISPGGEALHGWGIVIGTDTAFVLGALAIIGPTFATQLRIFLLTLTIIDDIVAVAVIGVVYSGHLSLGWLGVAGLALALLVLLDRMALWHAAPYVVLVLVLWFATLESGVHASIAGMLGGLAIQARRPRPELVEGAASRFRAFRQAPLVSVARSARIGLAQAVSVNGRLQSALHPWTSFFVVPVFALANAGVDLRNGVLEDALSSRLTWAVVVGLVVGKAVGITATSLLGDRWGVGRLPRGVQPGHVAGGATLSGIGFTVALLIAGLAFDDVTLRNEARVGILLAALFATLLGWVVFVVSRVVRGEGDADLPRKLAPPVDRERDHVRGPMDAPLTLVEYGDFECPFCARNTGLARELGERLGDRLRYVFRHLPLPDVHDHAELAARAAEAAAAQGKFWEMHDLLFEHNDELELEDLAGYAGDLHLDIEKFMRDLDDTEIHERIRVDVESAEASGARGTPTFFVNGERHVGPYDARTLELELTQTAPGRANMRT